MKLMVGKSGGSTAVFLVDGATALNLTDGDARRRAGSDGVDQRA